MNIIFGDAVNLVSGTHIVLELDTIAIQPINHSVKTWCVVETVPREEANQIALNKKLHSDLMIEYRNQNWNTCVEIIKQLTGKWSGEVDTFYQELLKRIENLKINPPEPGWDGSVHKNIM